MLLVDGYINLAVKPNMTTIIEFIQQTQCDEVGSMFSIICNQPPGYLNRKVEKKEQILFEQE